MTIPATSPWTSFFDGELMFCSPVAKSCEVPFMQHEVLLLVKDSSLNPEPAQPA